MELCLYNSVLTGISMDGQAFTYVNQLGSSDADPSERHKWFECACCPPNVSRLLGYLGGYLWTFNSDAKSRASINVHLYCSATLSFPVEGGEAKVTQKTEWPWAGDVQFTVESPPSISIDVALRIPNWASEWKVCSYSSFLCVEFLMLMTSIDRAISSQSSDGSRLSASSCFVGSQ